MNAEGPAYRLEIRDGALVQGNLQTMKSVMVAPDEAVCALLEGKPAWVSPRIVEAVTKTMQLLLGKPS